MAASFKVVILEQTLLLLSVIFVFAEAASIFDAFSASVGSLFTEQEEAPYTVIRTAADYEERKYASTKWICVNGTDIKQSSSRQQQETFLKLFSYIEGENAGAITIDMTIPVSIEYRHENLKGSPVLSACFYLGTPYQTEEPPAPTDTTLSIVTREPMTIFTRKISGFLNRPKEWLTEAKSLSDILIKAGKNIRRDLMFWNAFDSPAKFWNRRNEVWLVKQNEVA